MERMNWLFHRLAILPLGYIAFAYVIGLFARTDDWCYTNTFLSWNQLMIAFSIGLYLFPHIFEKVSSSPFTLVEVMILIAIFGFLAAIAVPNFKKAREGGYSVGGAKDINTFRMNIAKGYLPNETDITYEGLFYDYYFNTIDETSALASAPAGAARDLFTPVCSWAMLKNPLGTDTESFAAVGLRSGIDTNDIHRKKLNLVVVLDISGSMSGGFRSYYYDQFVSEKEQARIDADSDRGSSKMIVAAKALTNMLDLLNSDDRFGMVVFNSGGMLAKPLREIRLTDIEALKGHIMDINPNGGTNMEAGMTLGRTLLRGYENSNPEEYENRLIFLTDAMPNTGRIGRDGIFDLAKKYASEHIYTTFIGVGVDFQTELVEYVTKIRGANYYAIHSSWEFKKRLNKEFVYMVTPMLFDLTVTLHSDSFAIDEVYGSPEADQKTGQLMKVNTLFPAPHEEDAVKGGVILLKLRRKGAGNDLRLVASYEDRSGKEYRTTVSSEAPSPDGEWCASPDVRKAVLLARLVRLMKDWIRSERGPLSGRPENAGGRRNYWEHTSRNLEISPPILADVKKFNDYFSEQSRLINDSDLNREKEILESLAKLSPQANVIESAKNSR